MGMVPLHIHRLGGSFIGGSTVTVKHSCQINWDTLVEENNYTVDDHMVFWIMVIRLQGVLKYLTKTTPPIKKIHSDSRAKQKRNTPEEHFNGYPVCDAT